ncbi:hypothetical protein BU23DRAFT_103253 [Bimuria novae-zelandiae CBS 107.79]|uniref:NACHT domain-containing protein n=1 Tax=Bimuria novae-zelandiae CBS 107.79 TaxID=1447943 RepID=A0A6A5VQU0_9PLEO|nr:hypothetical protein BU23DRAFT_103253 [Bimuria novae-zelandiae CBS 107.79]
MVARARAMLAMRGIISFARGVDFVKRGTLLNELCKKCALLNASHAVVGLGGAGKSQLAIEHAYRTREQSPETWVFWAIAGRQDPQANIFKLVYDWLHDSKERWLLVLDNVDDARFLLDVQAYGPGQAADSRSAARLLRDYLPYCERGLVLITTRNKEAALKLVEQRDIITVAPMDEAQAQALFEKKLGVQRDNSDVTELAAALEYMPLAIVQAAAYISQSAPRCSVAQYLEEFRRSDGEKTSLLDHEAGHLRRDREAKNSIIITW